MLVKLRAFTGPLCQIYLQMLPNFPWHFDQTAKLNLIAHLIVIVFVIVEDENESRFFHDVQRSSIQTFTKELLSRLSPGHIK